MRRFIRWVLSLMVVLLLVVSGWYGYQRWDEMLRTARGSPAYQVAVVTRDTIASTVSATGRIEPNAAVPLSFRTPGQVTKLYVTSGQRVSKGDVLAELDTTDLVLAVAQAKVTLEISQAQLAKLEKPASAEDIAAAEAVVEIAKANILGAEAALASAQANYESLLAGPTEEERQLNLAEVRQAEVAVKAAQQAYDQVKNLPNLGALPQASELERATLALEVARLKAALLDQPPDAAALAAARNQIAQAEVALQQAEGNLISAQSDLAALQSGPGQEELEILRAEVRQAQLNQLQAEYALERARLIAPFDGVVTEVNLHEGALSNATIPDIVLTDLSAFHMRLLVDEIDVRQIEVGQEVQISLDALPDANVTGRVTKLASTATDVNGVMVYEGVITLDATDAPLRAGMTATALITTAQVENVLQLPNQYIQLDRTTGAAFVYKMLDGEPVRQEVRLGLRNEQASQILDGLVAGDTVAIVSQSSEDQLRGTIFGDE